MPRLLPQLPRAVYTQSVQVLMITPSVQWSMVTLTLLGIVLPLEGKKNMICCWVHTVQTGD